MNIVFFSQEAVDEIEVVGFYSFSLWDGLMMTFLVLYSIILAYKGLSKAEKQNKG